MEIRELIDRTMLHVQHEVIRELKKHDSTIWRGLMNSESDTGVKEWWLVPPYFAGMLSIEEEIVLCKYDCCWWGRTTYGQALYMDWVIQEISRQTER